MLHAEASNEIASEYTDLCKCAATTGTNLPLPNYNSFSCGWSTSHKQETVTTFNKKRLDCWQFQGEQLSYGSFTFRADTKASTGTEWTHW